MRFFENVRVSIGFLLIKRCLKIKLKQTDKKAKNKEVFL